MALALISEMDIFKSMDKTTATVYAIENHVHFAPANGQLRGYLTRHDRDAALAKMRERAVRDGVSESAARAGILPVSVQVADQDIVEEIDRDPGMLFTAGQE